MTSIGNTISIFDTNVAIYQYVNNTFMIDVKFLLSSEFDNILRLGGNIWFNIGKTQIITISSTTQVI